MKCTPLQFSLTETLYTYHVKYCAGSTKTYEYLMAIINITCSITLPTQYSSDQSCLKLSHSERALLPPAIRLTIRGEGRKTKQITLPSSWLMQWVGGSQKSGVLRVTVPRRMAQSSYTGKCSRLRSMC